MKCRNCDQQLKVGEFVSESVLFPGKKLQIVEHADETRYCGSPHDPSDKRTAQLPLDAVPKEIPDAV